MRQEGLEPTIPARKLPQSHTPDPAAIGIGIHVYLLPIKIKYFSDIIKILFFLALKEQASRRIEV
jgi:hypothetical protein